MQTSAKKECEGVQVSSFGSSFESAPNSRNLSARSRCPKHQQSGEKWKYEMVTISQVAAMSKKLEARGSRIENS